MYNNIILINSPQAKVVYAADTVLLIVVVEIKYVIEIKMITLIAFSQISIMAGIFDLLRP